MSAKIKLFAPQLCIQGYLRPIVDFLALKFGILIAKRLCDGNSISTNHACMLVANKIGQKVQFRIFFQKDTTDD